MSAELDALLIQRALWNNGGAREADEALARLIRSLDESAHRVVGLSADVTRQRERLANAVGLPDALPENLRVKTLEEAVTRVLGKWDSDVAGYVEMQDHARAAEVRVKELEQQVSALRAHLTEVLDQARYLSIGSINNTAQLRRMSRERYEEIVAFLARLAEALPASSVVPVEAGTGTGSAEERRAPAEGPA